METSNENKQNLLRLIQQNPDLPVIPYVSNEAACSEYSYTLARFADSHINEFLICDRYDDGYIIFKDSESVMDALEYYLSDEEFEALPENEEDCRPYYDALPWVKAIIVYIEP